jgi:hypothetical protein
LWGREVARSLLPALAVIGAVGGSRAFAQALSGACGFVWG